MRTRKCDTRPLLVCVDEKGRVINESGRGRGKEIYADVTRGLALDWKKQRQKSARTVVLIPESDIPSLLFFPPSSSRPITSHHVPSHHTSPSPSPSWLGL